MRKKFILLGIALAVLMTLWGVFHATGASCDNGALVCPPGTIYHPYFGTLYPRWMPIAVFVGTEVTPEGQVPCWGPDKYNPDPRGYVNHWREVGGWVWHDSKGYVVLYHWYKDDGYFVIGGIQQHIGPVTEELSMDKYGCWPAIVG